MRVKKRNGRREDFIREKIVVSVLKAGGNVRRARNIAREVERVISRSSAATTQQIRTEVLDRLKNRDTRAYRGWLAYDRQYKRRA